MRTLSPYFLEVQRKRFPPCICLGTSAQPFSLSEMSQDQGYQFWGVGTLVPPAPWQWAAWGGPTALSALTGTSYFHSPRTLLCHALPGLCRAMLSCFSRVRLFVNPRTVARQAPLSMGILQARILEWVAMSSSRGSSWLRDWTCVSYVSCVGRWVLYH